MGAGRAVAAVAPLRAAPGAGSARFPSGDFDSPPEVAPPASGSASLSGARGVSARGLSASRPSSGSTPCARCPRCALLAGSPPDVSVSAARSRWHGLGGCRPRALSLPAWGPGSSALSGSLHGRRRSPPLSARAHVRVRLCRAAPLSSGPGSGRFPCVLPSPTPWPAASVSPGFLSVSLSLSLPGYLPDFSCLSGVSVCLSSITVSLALRLSLSGFLFGPLSDSVSDLSISLFRSLSPPAPHSLPSP